MPPDSETKNIVGMSLLQKWQDGPPQKYLQFPWSISPKIICCFLFVRKNCDSLPIHQELTGGVEVLLWKMTQQQTASLFAATIRTRVNWQSNVDTASFGVVPDSHTTFCPPMSVILLVCVGICLIQKKKVLAVDDFVSDWQAITVTYIINNQPILIQQHRVETLLGKSSKCILSYLQSYMATKLLYVTSLHDSKQIFNHTCWQCGDCCIAWSSAGNEVQPHSSLLFLSLFCCSILLEMW